MSILTRARVELSIFVQSLITRYRFRRVPHRYIDPMGDGTVLITCGRCGDSMAATLDPDMTPYQAQEKTASEYRHRCPKGRP